MAADSRYEARVPTAMVEVICTQYFTFLSSVIIFANILMIGGQIIA